MGITKTRDGRYLVGQGVTDGNEYKGSLAWRDIVIQLSADGATAESIEKLEFLRDYGLYHSGEGNSVMPPSVSVWISNNGTTTAVEADDITVDGSNYTICGIKWNGSAWDFSQAGQGGGGGGLPPYTSADKGKVLTVGEGSESETVTIVPEQTVTLTIPEGREHPEPAILTNTYIAGLAAGQTGVLTVNGASDNITVGIFAGEFEIVSETLHCSVFSENGELFFGDEDEGEYTVILSVLAPSVEPKWEAASGGGLPKIHISGGGLFPASVVSTYDEILAIYQTGSAAMLWSDDESLDKAVLYPLPEHEEPGGTIRKYSGVVVDSFSGSSTSASITSYNIILADDGTTQNAVFTQVIKTVALSGGSN